MASVPAAGDKNLEENVVSSSSLSLDIWKDRIIIPTIVAGGPVAAARYSVIFAVVGTTFDAALKLKPVLRNFYGSLVGMSDQNENWFKLPEWSPIQVLDEETPAAKRAREEQMYRKVHNLNNEKS